MPIEPAAAGGDDALTEPLPSPGNAAEDGDKQRPSYTRGLAFAVGSFLSTVLLSVVSSILTARLFGVVVIGEYALVMAPYVLLTQISTLREQIAFVRRIAVLPRRDEQVTGLLVVILAFSTVVTLIAAVLVGLLNALVLNVAIDEGGLLVPSIVLLLSYLLFENVSWNLDMLYSAYGAGKELFVLRLVVAVSFLVVAVGLSTVREDVWTLVIASVASMALGLGARMTVLNRFIQLRVSRAAVREAFRELPAMIKFGISVTPGTAAQSLAFQSMVWFVGALSNTAAVGAFSRALNLAGRLLDAGYRLNEMMFPQLVRQFEVNDRRRFASSLATTIRLGFAALLGIAACGAGAARGVLVLLFGEDFAPGGTALSLLFFAMVAYVMSQLINQAVVATNRPWRSSAYDCLGAMVTLGSLCVLTPAFGGAGAGASLLLGATTEVTTVCIRERAALFAGHAHPYLLYSVRAAVLAAIGAFFVAHIVTGVVPLVVSPILGVGLALLCYCVVFVVTGGLTADERRMVLSRLRKALPSA